MKTLLLVLYFFINTAYAKNLAVTLVLPDKQGPIFWQFVSDVSQSASLSLNIDLEIIYGDSNRFALKNTIDKLLLRKQKPDYLIFRPFLGNTVSIFDDLEKNQLKFVTLEQAFHGKMEQKIGSPQQKYKYWLGQINYDNKAGGELLLNTLVAAQLKKRPNDKIYVTAISGDFDKVSKDREYIFSQNKKINLLGNITINQIIPMYWDPNNVTERFSMLEKRYPNTNIYWCAGDQLALKVLELKGDKDLVIGGFDWLPVALQKIKKGELDASVGGHFLMATIGLIKIVDYENGFNTFLNPPLLNKFEVITRANIDSHLAFFEKKLWQKINFNSYLASQNKQPPLLSITNLIEKYNQEKAVK